MTRKEAIEILWQYDVDFEPHPAEKIMHAIDMAIEALSAEAVQGEWHNRNSDGTWATVDFAYCSKCKQPIIHKHASPLWRFCPNCGAKMGGK